MKERLKELLRQYAKAAVKMTANALNEKEFQQATVEFEKLYEELLLSLLPTEVDVEKEAAQYIANRIKDLIDDGKGDAKVDLTGAWVAHEMRLAVKYGASLTSQQQPDKLPLSKLANDKEMCEKVAEMLGRTLRGIEYHEQYKATYLSFLYDSLLRISNSGTMSLTVDNKRFDQIPNALQIASLILTKYKIGE